MHVSHIGYGGSASQHRVTRTHLSVHASESVAALPESSVVMHRLVQVSASLVRVDRLVVAVAGLIEAFVPSI